MDSNMYTQLSNDIDTINDDKVFSILPPGYKFCPNDVELIDYYLKQKLAGDSTNPSRFYDVDVYKYSPQELEKVYKYKGEKEMYFFTRRSKKYDNGHRPDRAVENRGFWKATGKENSVTNNDIKIGFKRTLVFYIGKQGKSTASEKINWKTNWIMQEFSSSATCNMDDWVLCKIYENQYRKKCQITSQNNQNVMVSTNIVVTSPYQSNQHFQTQQMQASLSSNMDMDFTPQYQLSQHFETQQMQDSLLSNMDLTQQYQFNQHSQAQQMQTSLSSNIDFMPQYQLNQHFQAQQMQASLSTDMDFTPQYQLNQHFQAQQMQTSFSSNMNFTPQYQLNQHFQVQQMQDSLSTDMVSVPQYQPNQNSQAHQMQTSLSSNMKFKPQYQLNQHFQAQQMQDSLSTDMLSMPQYQPNQHSQAQIDEEYGDPFELIDFDR